MTMFLLHVVAVALLAPLRARAATECDVPTSDTILRWTGRFEAVTKIPPDQSALPGTPHSAPSLPECLRDCLLEDSCLAAVYGAHVCSLYGSAAAGDRDVSPGETAVVRGRRQLDLDTPTIVNALAADFGTTCDATSTYTDSSTTSHECTWSMDDKVNTAWVSEVYSVDTGPTVTYDFGQKVRFHDLRVLYYNDNVRQCKELIVRTNTGIAARTTYTCGSSPSAPVSMSALENFCGHQMRTLSLRCDSFCALGDQRLWLVEVIVFVVVD